METLIQTASRINQSNYDANQGKLAPFEGLIVQVDGADDTLGISFGPVSNRPMPVPHPFVGSNSWIRSMPNTGARMLMQNRFDTGQPEALKTLPLGGVQRTQGYQSQTNTYREMDVGEHDLASGGYAMSFYGRRGNLDHRAGVGQKSQLNRDALEVLAAAPTHKTNLLQQTVGEMGDERRLGVLKRWKSPIEEYYVVDANNNYLSESYLHLKNPAGSAPAILLKRQEGHVYDDAGQQINQFSTSHPLRSQTLWYTVNDLFTRHEVDDQGNVYHELPTTATTGYELNVQKGNYNATIGVDRNVLIQRDETVSVKGNIQYTVQGNVQYTVTKDIQMKAGENTLLMSTASGAEGVTLTNPKGYGMVATNSGGGSTMLTGPSGSAINMDSSGNINIKDGNGASLSLMGQSQMATLKSPMTVSLDGQTILLGTGAAISAAMGISLMAYLDQHTHTTTAPGAPTSPPTVPSASFIGTPQSIISSNVLLIANL